MRNERGHLSRETRPHPIGIISRVIKVLFRLWEGSPLEAIHNIGPKDILKAAGTVWAIPATPGGDQNDVERINHRGH